MTETNDPVDALSPDTLRDELWSELLPFWLRTLRGRWSSCLRCHRHPTGG